MYRNKKNFLLNSDRKLRMRTLQFETMDNGIVRFIGRYKDKPVVDVFSHSNKSNYKFCLYERIAYLAHAEKVKIRVVNDFILDII